MLSGPSARQHLCPGQPALAAWVLQRWPAAVYEQQPDLLVDTGRPVSGRIVLVFLFITGWLAILHGTHGVWLLQQYAASGVSNDVVRACS